MQDRIDALLNQVGRPYKMYNDDGTYQGCFYPIQFLYPDKPKYKLRSEDDDQNYWYGIEKLKKHCTEINSEELKPGDIVITKYKNELHAAIFLEYGKIIHVFKGHTLQVGRLKMFNNFQSFRVNV